MRARSSGEKLMAPAWKKSRVWSSAMMTITAPRSASTAVRRAAGSDRSLVVTTVATDSQSVGPGAGSRRSVSAERQSDRHARRV